MICFERALRGLTKAGKGLYLPSPPSLALHTLVRFCHCQEQTASEITNKRAHFHKAIGNPLYVILTYKQLGDSQEPGRFFKAVCTQAFKYSQDSVSIFAWNTVGGPQVSS